MSTTPKPTGYDGVLTMDEVAKIASRYDPTGSMFGDITALAGSHERLWDVHSEVRGHVEAIRIAATSPTAAIAHDHPVIRAIHDLLTILEGAPVTPVFDRLEYLEGEYDRLRKALAGAALEDETRG